MPSGSKEAGKTELIIKILTILIAFGSLVTAWIGITKLSSDFQVVEYIHSQNSTTQIAVDTKNSGWNQAGKTSIEYNANRAVRIANIICPESNDDENLTTVCQMCNLTEHSGQGCVV
jgi:hypothetical protein